MKTRARIALRVNPDVDPKTHPYISTGLKKNKFGIDIEQALKSYARARDLEHIEVVGIDCHIGSQLTEIPPFIEALERLKLLIARLKEIGICIQYVDIGGGLGIPYHQESPPHPREYAQAIVHRLKDLSCSLILEPGRVIVGNAGVLLTEVIYAKKTPSKEFIIIDAGMNDLVRPSLLRVLPRYSAGVARPAGIPGGRCGGADLRVLRFYCAGSRYASRWNRANFWRL